MSPRNARPISRFRGLWSIALPFRLRRALCLLLALLTLAPLLCSCARPAASLDPAQPGDGFDHSFTDSLGTAVSLTKRPETVAVLFSSFADIWCTAGGTVDITVGESVSRGFAAADAVLLDPGSGHTTIDLESLVAAAPDIVIGTADYACQVEAVDFCRTLGIPAALFRVECFADYLTVLRIFCELTGEPERYERFGLEPARRIDALLEKTAPFAAAHTADILFVRAGSSERSTKAKTAEDNFACAMLSELGARNIADAESALTGELSLELIVEANPDLMFISTMGDEQAARGYMDSKLDADGWRELDCVKHGRVFYLPKELFHFKPNARWAEAYEYLASILYPELEL